MPKDTDKWIEDLAGALFDPIIVVPGGWGESLPDWIRPAIKEERLIENMQTIAGKEPTATDAEAVAYLYTASLTAAISESWARIYIYIAGKVMARHMKAELPDDIKVDTLNEYDQKELDHLKAWIYQKRLKARKRQTTRAMVGRTAEPPVEKPASPQLQLF